MFERFRKVRLNDASREGPEYAVAEGVKSSEHTGGLVLLNTAKGTVHSSNAVGARIWAGLGSGHTVNRIAAGIARDFGVDEEVAHRDAARFVEELRAAGLLRSSGRNETSW